MGISELYQIYLHHSLITTDSRNCPKDSIFFALKGEKFDGNLFAEQALAAGSDYAVIDNPDYSKGERTILVENVLITLQQLAQYHRRFLGTPIIAITGTNGKTTTKELLAAVLSTKYNLLYTEGNLNNQIGVPLTLLRLKRDHEIAIIEMGASHLGDICELVEIAQPDYGIITNVGKAHLENFGSFENIVKTKNELYDHIRWTKGVIFINKDDKNLQEIAKGIEQVGYGQSEDAFVSGNVINNTPYLIFDWKQQEKTHTIKTHLIGSYNLNNLLAAIAVGRYFKIPVEYINRAIAAYVPRNNRSQLMKVDKNELIIDTYNANPGSMKAALNNFAEMNVYPKVIILGDMKELGLDSEALHLEIIEQIKEAKFDKVYLCGEYFSKTGQGFNTYSTTEDLKKDLINHPLSGYYILIKGSRSMAMEKIIDVFNS